MTNDDQPTQPARRDWLAALLLQRPEGFLARFAAGAARLRALPRGLRRRLQRRAAAAALGAALVFGLAGGAFLTPTAHALEINVDDGIVYVDDDDGFCSLFEAINNANSGTQYSTNTGECETGSAGADTINLPLNGNFVLTDDYVRAYYSDNGLPVISSAITIAGNGSTIARDTVNPTPWFRIMAVNGDGDLTLNDVVISGGKAESEGGAIYVYEGKLTLNGSTISHSYAETDGGGIIVVGSTDQTAELNIHNSVITYNETGFSDGGGLALGPNSTTTLTDSTISFNQAGSDGGGIFLAAGALDISGSTISDNYANGEGGGLYLDNVSIGVVTITNSTIRNNTTEDKGGAIFVDDSNLEINGSTLSGNGADDGGGMYIEGNESVVTITNSTISDNSASDDGGGIYNDEGALTLNNVTITDNSAERGGGLFKWYDFATLTINRSLVSGNTADEGAEVFIVSGTASSDNHNVFGHSGLTTEEAFYNFSTGASDMRATSNGSHPTALAAILDPTLADNGGPTLTHNLVPGSPALDIAPDADCAADPTNGVDQRGEARPFDVPGVGIAGESCDAGAVEYASADDAIFMSTKKSGTTSVATGGVAFDNSDILKWDGTNWSKFFDGTDAHLDPVNKPKHNINAFWIDDNDDIIMSFAQNGRKVGDLPAKVDGMDLVKWDGSAFSLWFDGSDVGLTKKTGEKIDALHVLPGDAAPLEFGGACEAYLLLSTQGAGDVPAFGGGKLKFGGEDILGFCLTNWGEATAGFWHMALDGSAVGLPKNSLDSISVSDDGGMLYFTTSKVVNLDGGVSGGHSMIYAYDGNTFSGPLFVAADNGLGQMVDGLQTQGEVE